MDTLTRMRAYVSVVDNEGFSAAGRVLGRSKALLSKYVRELEDEIGVLLINRTTRQFSLTEAGHIYYARSIALLQEFDSLQDMMRDTGDVLRGKLRVSAPRAMADSTIGRCLIDFAAANREVSLDVELDDRFVDMVEEGFDVAIRIAKLEDSSLIARRLAPFRVILCASKATISRYGEPKTASEIEKLPCIVDTNARGRNAWPLRDDEGHSEVAHVSGPLTVNSPLTARLAVLKDLGFALIPDFIIRDDIAAGDIVEIMKGRIDDDMAIYAVYPHRRYLPAKTRALVDFLADWFKKNARS